MIKILILNFNIYHENQQIFGCSGLPDVGNHRIDTLNHKPLRKNSS